jgi:uracil-DNA glycosylase family 4
MGADQNFDWKQAVASALDWWREAGVDATIDETPRNWLVRPAPTPAIDLAVTIGEAVAASGALPDTLAAFEAWRVGADAPEAGWHSRPFAAAGNAAAEILIVIDMPEREDAESGHLLSGAAGRLFDRMLAAIGRDRSSVYLVPLCAARPAAARIAPEIEARLGELLAHHIALASPKRVLLMGNAPSRAMLGLDFLRARGSLRPVNHEAGTIRGDFEAVATFHPRFLIEQPAKKAEAWKDLQMLIGGLQQ